MDLIKYFNKFNPPDSNTKEGGEGVGGETYVGAILLHRVTHLVALVPPTFTGEEAVLAHVEVEALQTPVPGGQDSQYHQHFRGSFLYLKPRMGFCLQMLHFA